MKAYKIFIAALSFCSVLFFSSCSDEIIETENITQVQNGQRGDGGNNGGDRNGGGTGGNNGGGTSEGQAAADIDSEVLITWMDLFMELDQDLPGMRPNAVARTLAYINLAAYETAIPVMPDYNSNELLIKGFNISQRNMPRELDVEIALNAAYAEVFEHFLFKLPDNLIVKIPELEEQLSKSLSIGVDRDLIRDSERWGNHIAEEIIEYSQTDRSAEAQVQDPQPTSYIPPTGLGYWTFSAEPERALFPYWERVRTFGISGNETSTIPPLAYSTDPQSEYYQQMEEVYHANNDARAKDGEELWIAEFWSDDVENLMFSPPTRQVSIANQLIKNESLNLEEALVFNLKLGFSLNDAAVSTWKYKYEHMVMRPSVFIQNHIDDNYQTNLFRLIPWPNPSFPAYPSGHSCFASAGAGVFIDVFGDNYSFTDYSHDDRTEFRGAARTFSTFSELAEENAYSRIPLGVHMRMDCDEGLRLGYEISDAINAMDLKKNDI